MNRTPTALLAAVSLLISAPLSASAAVVDRAGCWAASAQPPNAVFESSWSAEGFSNQTVRQVVRITAGGPLVRIRPSTVHSGPVELAGATIARTADGAAVRPGSLRRLTFAGRPSVAIPAGREITSAAATGYRAGGDHLADAKADAFTETTRSWYFLGGVDVVDTTPGRTTVVAFGDSITDGTGSTADADNRYPDELAERSRGRYGVLNRPDVRSVVVLEGVDDIVSSDIDFECFTPNDAGYHAMAAALDLRTQ